MSTLFKLFGEDSWSNVTVPSGNRFITWSALAKAWLLQFSIVGNESPPFLHHSLLYLHRNSSPYLIPLPPPLQLAIYRHREMIQRIISELSGV